MKCKQVQSALRDCLGARKQCGSAAVTGQPAHNASHESDRGKGISEFAKRYRLRLGLDELWEKVIPGKLGDVYEYSPALLGLMFMPDPARPRIWPAARKCSLRRVSLFGRTATRKGRLAFNPADPVQAKLALRVVKIRVRRVLSSAETEARRTRMGQVNARRHDSLELTSRMGV